MQTSGLSATLAALLLGIGITKYDNNSRIASQAWKYIDGGAQSVSLLLASQLLHSGAPLAGAIGPILVILAIIVGYGHYSNMKNANPTWNYIDGANLALWGSVILSELGRVA